MNAVVKEVKLQVKEGALFRNLEHAFSANTVINELLQNARRAGASQIHVLFDGSRLSVFDNGRGIGDLQNLLTAAASGWDNETSAVEHPFGLGFLSTLYVCKEVVVSTRAKGAPTGQVLTANTEDLLAQKSAVVTGDHDEIHEGVGVHLIDFNMPALGSNASPESRVEALRRVLERVGKGFPVPLSYNGVDVMREHATDDSFTATDVGLIRMGLGPLACYCEAVYLQGLPVHIVGRANPSGLGSEMCVIHLDASFLAKLPDRTELLDGAAAERRILEAKRVHARHLLEIGRAHV